jgi:hypothetical protein
MSIVPFPGSEVGHMPSEEPIDPPMDPTGHLAPPQE